MTRAFILGGLVVLCGAARASDTLPATVSAQSEEARGYRQSGSALILDAYIERALIKQNGGPVVYVGYAVTGRSQQFDYLLLQIGISSSADWESIAHYIVFVRKFRDSESWENCEVYFPFRAADVERMFLRGGIGPVEINDEQIMEGAVRWEHVSRRWALNAYTEVNRRGMTLILSNADDYLRI